MPCGRHVVCCLRYMWWLCSHVYVVAILAQVEPTTCGQQMGIGGLADFSAHPPPMTEKKRKRNKNDEWSFFFSLHFQMCALLNFMNQHLGMMMFLNRNAL